MRLRRLFLLNAVVFTGFVGHGRMIAVVHAVAGRRPRSAAVGIGLALVWVRRLGAPLTLYPALPASISKAPTSFYPRGRELTVLEPPFPFLRPEAVVDTQLKDGARARWPRSEGHL